MDNLITTDLDATFKALRNRDPIKVARQRIESHPDYRRIPSNNYAPVAAVEYGGTKMTRQASNMIYGQPTFFSPVHTPINWQIPSKRLEQYQWSRFFYENEPKVGSAIDFYSQFPMSDWEHECKNRDVKNYFDHFKKRLQLPKWTRMLSHEIHLLGDCFPFLEIDCEHCMGTGRIGEEMCEHEGGTIRRIIILNPDYVEVHTTPLNPDPVIALRPDEELINMVSKKMPGYEKLSPEVIRLIATGQPIRLDNRSVSHLKYGECGYQKYGIGMVRRLFPILSYKTKLMVAQWIVAERLIVPIKIVKVGSDERPAGPADIASVQAMLANTSNDPNLTLVTHHAFDLEWYGACHDDNTEVLTENGWKKYEDVSKNFDEKIATYNLNNDKIEYEIPQKYHEYDYNGELCTFSGRHYDIAVTPNHKMLASMREWDANREKYTHSNWECVTADNIGENSRFKCVAEWSGSIPEELPYKSEKLLSNLSLDEYLEFVGYYLSEGDLKIDKGVINAVSISQKENSPSFDMMKKSIFKVSSKIQESEDTRTDPSCWMFYINDCEFAREISKTYGATALDKRIPRWILNLPKRELIILLNALMAGDGNVRFSLSGTPRYKYTTISKDLADAVQELVLKIGYNPKCNKSVVEIKNRNDIYTISWCESLKNRKFVSVKDRNIGRVAYNGKVWCFTVPNGFFITRRNGKVTIQGNSGKVLTLSNEFEFINQEILDGMMINNALLNGEGPNFSSAAVGIEAMIQRLNTFRSGITSWLEEAIYLPEAKRQGFKDKNPETGKEEWIVPKIKWDSMHLRDQRDYRQFVVQLYEKGLLSAQTVLETFDFDPDQEIERKRFDALQMVALGQGFGQSGMSGPGGGGGGGMPGGGGGGGMPPIAPGGPGEVGGAPAAPTGMGEGGGPQMQQQIHQVTAEVANPNEFGGKVLKKRKRDALKHEQERMYRAKSQKEEKFGVKGGDGQIRDEKGQIIFTSAERNLIPLIQQAQRDGLMKDTTIYPQFRVPVANTEYSLDFAIPNLKIAIEADGEIFHSAPKQKQHDDERDMGLQQQGWTVLRYTDSEIEGQPQAVIRDIVKNVMEKQMWLQEKMKDK